MPGRGNLPVTFAPALTGAATVVAGVRWSGHGPLAALLKGEAMPRTNSDPIKAAVAAMVKRRLRKIGEDIIFEELPIVSIEVQEPDELNTLVRVRTNGQGTRYFNVKVSEMM